MDGRQAAGNIFRVLEQAQRFLRENLPVAGRVVPNLFERIDDPLYPPEATREALANAVCHRDYTAPGGAVSVAIYDDRLEISSTGRLPFGLTPADLAQPHTSRPWNPLIAQVLYRRGVIEQWGRGTIKMRELAERAGLARPEFDDRGGEVVVRFYPTAYIPPSRISHDLSPLQQQLLNLVASKGTARLADLTAALPEVPMRTIQDNLKALRDWNLLDGTGKGRGASWKLRGATG